MHSHHDKPSNEKKVTIDYLVITKTHKTVKDSQNSQVITFINRVGLNTNILNPDDTGDLSPHHTFNKHGSFHT